MGECEGLPDIERPVLRARSPLKQAVPAAGLMHLALRRGLSAKLTEGSNAASSRKWTPYLRPQLPALLWSSFSLKVRVSTPKMIGS